MGVKYRMTFLTPEEDECKVDFDIQGYSGDPIILNPAESPFVLREFNTDDDIYKPLRGQQAEISFITNNSISINDFLGNNDTYCKVNFYYLQVNPYWEGYLMQDDFQEEWQDTNHVLILRASEGLGLLRSVQLVNLDGSELIGKYTFFNLLQIATTGSAQGWGRATVINDLYHTSMDDTSAVPPIAQSYIDANTFALGDGLYEDKYTVIEKINKAWSQTLFQWYGRWYILRVEELYKPTSSNLNYKNYNIVGFPSQWTASSQRWDIEVGLNETIKPIEPNMLRFIKRPNKQDQIDYIFDYPSELFPNQNFQRGSIVQNTATLKSYNINYWTNYSGSKAAPTPTGTQGLRVELYDSNGIQYENFIYVNSGGSETWMESQELRVQQGDVLDISFEWFYDFLSLQIGGLARNINWNVAQIFFRAGNLIVAHPYQALNEQGDWKYIANFADVTAPYIRYKYPNMNGIFQEVAPFEWTTKSILTDPIPYDGYIKILFPNNLSTVSNQPCIKNLSIKYQTTIKGINTTAIAGIYDRFTKSEDIRSNFEEQIYMDDIQNYNAKGTIYAPNNTTLTTQNGWYRKRYNSERFSFKKENLIANWEQTRYWRNKIDVNFYGLKQNGRGIGIINTVIFTEDDPNKIYYIANLKEVNFARGTWAATLVEVWDNDRDPDVATTYPTYNAGYLYK